MCIVRKFGVISLLAVCVLVFGCDKKEVVPDKANLTETTAEETKEYGSSGQNCDSQDRQ